MKKRIAAFLLAAAMLTLAACGRKDDRVPATDKMQMQETQATEAATEPEIDAEAVYLSLQGYYQDSVSQRATLYAWLTDGGLGLRVNWSSSASEETEWDMTAVLTQDNKLEYSNGTRFRITYLEENEYDSQETASNQQGYFTIADGKLLWNGAADEECRACVFELLPEDAWPQSWEPEYPGVYWRMWHDEIAGNDVEMNEYIVLNEDYTGYWIAQDVGTLTWDESQLMLTVGAAYEIALTQEDGNQIHLLVYEFQDESGAWIPTAFDKIEKLPAEMEEMLARFFYHIV